MKECPILFSTPMVQAILAGRKIQTRRIFKRRVLEDVDLSGAMPEIRGKYQFLRLSNGDEFGGPIRCPYGLPGDHLWVRETTLLWRKSEDGSVTHAAAFKADGYKLENGERWTPSIHVPKKCSRIWLEIVNVRVERLQDISEADARAEGVECFAEMKWKDYLGGDKNCYWNARGSFFSLWDSINEKQGCESRKNPWVWVVEFKPVTKGGAIERAVKNNQT